MFISELWQNSGIGSWQIFPATVSTRGRPYSICSFRLCCQMEMEITGQIAPNLAKFLWKFTKFDQIFMKIYQMWPNFMKIYCILPNFMNIYKFYENVLPHILSQVGHSQPLLLYFRLVNNVDKKIKIANDWNRTADLWCRKRPLSQLCHCPNNTAFATTSNKIKFLVLATLAQLAISYDTRDPKFESHHLPIILITNDNTGKNIWMKVKIGVFCYCWIM